MEQTAWMFPLKGQQWLKALHITLAAISLGGSVVILILLGVKLSDARFHYDFSIDYINYRLFNGLIYYTFLGNIATALCYSLYTRWGFVRFRWLAVKWALLIALLIIVLGFFGAHINSLAGFSDSGLNRDAFQKEYDQLLARAFVFAAALVSLFLTIFLLSAVRPWGKGKRDLFPNVRTARRILLPIVALGMAFGLFNTIQLNQLRRLPIAPLDFSQLSDGLYTGVFEKGGGPYEVALEVQFGQLIDARLTSSRQSRYVKMAEGVLQRMVEEQSLQVDAITGATTTSQCILKAAEQAIRE